MKQLQTFKNDLSRTRIIQTQSLEIDEGEISVSIESFAFSSNNVTYGVAGDTIGYWQFFKATEDKMMIGAAYQYGDLPRLSNQI